MKKVLLSFSTDWWPLMEQGNMKFEYRKQLPKEECMVYFYVSSPIKAISGIAYCGPAEALADWIDKYQDRPIEVKERIKDYLKDCNYAIPIYKFQNTNYIPLDRLRKDIPGFIVPRMYYFINGTPLEEYLEGNIKVERETVFDHSVILDDDICNLESML